MITKTKVVAYQYITSKKTGQDFLKVWVKVPASDTCIGDPVETVFTPAIPGIKVDIGRECVVSVDRFGHVHDIQF